MTATLVDSFGRRIEYLRVSVTDRCNYRCFYCMPATGVAYGRHEEFLRHEEMARLVRLFAELGVHKVRLTGGEPLVRRGIVDLAGLIGRIPGITDLSLSTNGHLLERHAAALKAAGVARVNISLDSLDPDTFARITRGGDLGHAWRGIEAALTVGMTPVKLNMVVLKGINDREIESMLDFALARGAHLRYIETMPVGEAGAQGMEHYYSADAILARVRKKASAELIPVKGAPGAGPARCYRIGAGPATVGIISAISRHFCEGCNRVRLTAKGELVLCLGQDQRVSLAAALRTGASDLDLKDLIAGAIAQKPKRHRFAGQGACHPIHKMSVLGG
ncbi:MAG: GTP 3',8-cyclase MoaA [Sulfuricaulis sp.]|nr:GTP 3',8-cyclase MoaA [Sulfuricaulis sp.]